MSREEELKSNPLLNDKRTIEVVERILSKNDIEANKLREIWRAHGIYVVNLMSSPGSGKTTLLENLAELGGLNFGVIEGDLETNRDADRLKAIGVRAHQITTGSACHLEAHMVKKALDSFALEGLEYLVIENVGNLVCPASYDLGAHINIALLSIPEGDDKVLKYPTMFRAVDVLLLTKVDLIDYFDYSLERIKADMQKLKPDARIIEVSSKDEASIKRVADLLEQRRASGFISNHIF